MIEFLRSKLHGIRVTDASLNYRGSITIDRDICERAGLHQFEFVRIWNKTNGERLSTYVLHGPRNSRCCVLNGAAARKCQIGDELIIAASVRVEPAQVDTVSPRVLIFGPGNTVEEVIDYVQQLAAEAAAAE